MLRLLAIFRRHSALREGEDVGAVLANNVRPWPFSANEIYTLACV
jgi:hypothetical protein